MYLTATLHVLRGEWAKAADPGLRLHYIYAIFT
jgi:hypothetical protein